MFNDLICLHVLLIEMQRQTVNKAEEAAFPSVDLCMKGKELPNTCMSFVYSKIYLICITIISL